MSLTHNKSHCLDANYSKGVSPEYYKKKARRQLVFKEKSQTILATLHKENVKSMLKRNKLGLCVQVREKGKSPAIIDHTGGNHKIIVDEPFMLTERRTEEAKAIRKESLKNGRDFSPRRAKELVPRHDGKSNCLTTGLTKESLLVIPPQILQLPHGANQGGIKAKDGKTPSMTSSSWEHNNLLLQKNSWRKLMPLECERLQTVPDNYTEGVSNTQRYRMLGNGWTVDVIAYILGHMEANQ